MHRRVVTSVALVIATALAFGACARDTAAPVAAPQIPALQPQWSISDSLDVLNEALKSLVATGTITPRYNQLLDAVTAGEVKAHITLATQYVVSRKVHRDVLADPSVPIVHVRRLVAFTTDCVVARVVVDFTTQRANRNAQVPKLESYYALFRRDPAGPDPLGINPTGWRWEQSLSENVFVDPSGERVDKLLTGRTPTLRTDAPLNACHATAGLGDDCPPPAPEPPYPAENSFGRALVGLLGCPQVPKPPRSANLILNPLAKRPPTSATTAP